MPQSITKKIGEKLGRILNHFFTLSGIMKSKRKMTSIFAISAFAAIFAVAGFAEIPQSEAALNLNYKVTLTNITPGQPITPPVLVTHNKDVSIFTVGEESSFELSQLAENGNFDPLVEKLSGMAGVGQIVTGEAPLVPANDPGETDLAYTETFMISAEANARYLSFASMLVCTNDGFAGVDTTWLPHKTKTIYAKSYDARTEMNTEDFADMVPPCQGAIGVSSGEEGTGASDPTISEDGIVIPHPGIAGGEDLLPSVHGWDGPVVKIQIERMK